LSVKKILAIFAISVAAVVAVFGAITISTVFAQSPTPTPSTPGGAKPFGPMKGFGGGFTQQDLATALGVTPSQLTAAYQSATTEALKQAVTKGLLTQSQADAIAPRAGMMMAPYFTANGIDYNALLASALNISVDKLTAAYQTAYNAAIDRAVQNGRLTQAQADLAKGRYALFNNSKFKSALQSAFEAAVNQAVKDGIISQSQADQILKQQNGAGMPFPGFFGKPGGFGGRRGGFPFPGRGPFKNNPNAPAPTPSGGA
jgi:hypothetical protein